MITTQIPEIFPLDDQTIKAHLDQYAKNWRKLWDQFVEAQGKNKSLTLESKEKIKALQKLFTDCFTTHPISEQIIELIKLPKDTLFMVRSTGEEDTVEMANPGGNKSVAAVRLDAKSISKAIRTVVASYVSEKSLTQRLLSGDDISRPSFMPVLIQRMIGEKLEGDDANHIVVSGVMYADMNTVRIDAAPGHGELIVNSKAPFDTYDVTQAGLVHAEIHQKNVRLVPSEITVDNEKKRKLIFKDNPKKLQASSSVAPAIAKEIAQVGRSIAAHYGMPMDIEFVYQPHDKILYLVQARPIPQDVKHKITPSAIAPENWAKIKNDEKIEKIKANVITSASKTAKVINSADQVIHEKRIDMALKNYLEHPDLQNKIRAVLVKHEAPATSHEAAFFNAIGIPVLQVKWHTLKSWLKAEKPLLIIDPQHQCVVNWASQIKDHANAEKELRNEKVIVDGLFSSSLSQKKTLLPIDYTIDQSIEDTVKKYLTINEKIDTKHIYSQLLQYLEQVESAKAGDANIEAFAALRKIAMIFRKIGTSSQAKQGNTSYRGLLQHAMYSIAEIDQCLNAYSSQATTDNQINRQQQLFDLLAKLKGLVVNRSEQDVYSDSIAQIAEMNKTTKGIDVTITGEQREYLQEFLKLLPYIFRQSNKDAWSEFAIECSQRPYTRQLLAKIIKTSFQYHFESELVNIFFVEARETNTNQVKNILADLFTRISINEMEFEKYHINENERVIDSWESKISDWSNPAKFKRLFEEYTRELLPLVWKISIYDSMSSLTRKVLLKQVQHLTDVMDKSIKSMKGSPDYAGDKGKLLNNFADMLNPYLDLMIKWMKEIPAASYNKWNAKIGDYYNKKLNMINSIKKMYLAKVREDNEKHLQPSGYLSVSSARVGTPASFGRQVIQNEEKLTLEDLFTLMHQNILASTVILGKDLQITI